VVAVLIMRQTNLLYGIIGQAMLFLGMMSHVIKNPKTCWDSCRHLQFAWVFLLKAFKVQSMIGVAKFISELLDVMQGADSDNQNQTSTTISQISDQPGWLELM
jgi:hypothetical protein